MAASVSQSLKNAQTLKGQMVWTAAPAGKTVRYVVFTVDGGARWQENIAPYRYQGDQGYLDTTKLKDGSHKFQVDATFADGSGVRSTVTCTVANTAPVPPPTPTPPPDTGTIQWRGDFETGDLHQWHGVQAFKPERIAVVTDHLRQGKYAARFVIEAADESVFASPLHPGNSQRSQLSNENPKVRYDEGDEHWWAFSWMNDKAFQLSPNGWNIIGLAFHNTGSTGQGNVDFRVTGADLTMVVHYGADPLKPTTKPFKAHAFDKGVWHDYILHILWSTDPKKGLIEAWCDGKRFAPLTHTPTLYAGQGTYVKAGLYRHVDHTTRQVAYGDGFRRGDSYGAVVKDFATGWQSTPPA